MKTKEHILSILQAAGDNTVSGEDLAKQCGVSRTAVWKAVSVLRAEGYELEAGTNRGYRLVRESEALDAAAMGGFLVKLTGTADNSDNIAGFSEKIHIFKVTESTNIEAKKAVSSAAFLHTADGSLSEQGRLLHGAAFFAEMQTSGRGRLGRSFYSPANTGLYMTLSYIPCSRMQDPALLTASTAVGVCRAIERVYAVQPRIKWVNDVFLHGKKICGILAEGVSNFETGIIEAVVVGIGINIAETEDGFPDQISSVAGTILSSDDREQTGRRYLRRNELAATVIYEVMRVLDACMNSELDDAGTAITVYPIMQEFRTLSLFTVGQKFTVFPLAGDESSKYDAYFVSIDDNARLIVELADGTRRTLSSGEVTLHSSFSAKNKI